MKVPNLHFRISGDRNLYFKPRFLLAKPEARAMGSWLNQRPQGSTEVQ